MLSLHDYRKPEAQSDKLFIKAPVSIFLLKKEQKKQATSEDRNSCEQVNLTYFAV